MSGGDPHENVSISHKLPKSNIAASENKYFCIFGGIQGKFLKILSQTNFRFI